MELSSVDLNLLLAFEALWAERSVTRAGRKVGLSQPAMSGAKCAQPVAHAYDGNVHEKKPGSLEPGLRYWPCEADTITFQEG